MAYEKPQKDGYATYRNRGGKEIGAGIKGAVFQDGFAFRDLEGNGKLLPYTDSCGSIYAIGFGLC